MSRLIVKNLPKNITEDKLKQVFNQKGELTDINLKFTPDGVFRRFAFIGYKTAEEASLAAKYFNNTYINTSKIQVEPARNLADPDKPRAWSKYSKDSSAFQKSLGKTTVTKEDEKSVSKSSSNKPKKNLEKLPEPLQHLKELEKERDFLEFLEAHKLKPNAKWQESAEQVDAGDPETDEYDGTPAYASTALETERKEDVSDKIDDDRSAKTAEEMSDMEYLRTKIKGAKLSTSGNSKADAAKGKEKPEYKVKLRGLPVDVTKPDIIAFFMPVYVPEANIVLPKVGAGKGKSPGRLDRSGRVAYVRMVSENQVEIALRSNKRYMGENCVKVTSVSANSAGESAEAQSKVEVHSRNGSSSYENVSAETIADTGRIMARNIHYACTEADLEALFSLYGPLAEVHLPFDSFTRQIRGYAFITFVFPEHAVKAYAALDGTDFQGRVLHLIPGKAKPEDEVAETGEDAAEGGGGSYKKTKARQEKAAASSGHNWNTLFLGSSAVADVMAAKYNTSKSQILDPTSRKSLAVRMALGETQIVADTRNFLLKNGVSLDSFSQAAGERSKSVILAKNLPAGTDPAELRQLFAAAGGAPRLTPGEAGGGGDTPASSPADNRGHKAVIKRVVLPPHCLTALIEFEAAQEAKAAFRKLAYSKFKYVPLYLEWAPVNVFSCNKTEEPERDTKEDQGEKEVTNGAGRDNSEAEDDADEDEPEPDTIIFVKNLNFDTTDDSLRKMFERCGSVHSAVISKKKDLKNPGAMLSMGYGFVQYRERASAQRALKELQHSDLDGHVLDLKLSHRQSAQMAAVAGRKKYKEKKQTSAKILVRNLPFQCSRKEVQDLFQSFGELKSIRLPKKMGAAATTAGSSSRSEHRGFGFVEFGSRAAAKRAFTALCHSTHLYGRRLVLEWADAGDAENDVDALRAKTKRYFLDGPPNKRLKKSELTESLAKLDSHGTEL